MLLSHLRIFSRKTKVLLFSIASTLFVIPGISQVTVEGKLYISDGELMYWGEDAEITSTGVVINNGLLYTKGNVINEGSYRSSENTDYGKLIVQGSSLQEFNFNNDTITTLIVDNTSHAKLTATGLLDSLVFVNGTIQSQDTIMVDPSCVIKDATPDKYINLYGGGYIMQDSLAEEYELPIGTSDKYLSLWLTPNPNNRTYVSVMDSAYKDPTNTTGGSIKENGVNATWIVKGIRTLDNTSLSVGYQAADELNSYDRTTAGLMVWEENVSTNYLSSKGTTSLNGGLYKTEGVVGNYGATAGNTLYITLGDEENNEHGMLVDASFFLEGPFNGTDMNNGLGSGGASSILAQNVLKQPYNVTPFNYSGEDSVEASFFTNHTDIVDWVLIELRDTANTSTIVAQKACFLKTDGTTIGINGEDGAILNAPAGAYYIVVRHRNHVSVSTATGMDLATGTAEWDIRKDDSNIYKNLFNVKSINTSYALYAGDANADQDINATDNNLYWRLNTGSINTYQASDFDMNSDVNAGDINLYWRNNTGIVVDLP